MGTIDIQYSFTLGKEHHEVFDVHIDDQSLENINPIPAELPEWTHLTFHQCSHCPLEPASTPHCPVALCLVDITSRFAEIVSFEEMMVTVVTKERTVSQQTTAQRAISSLLGLIFATSGCPHTQFFKPMARFHLPLATEEDTIMRAAGMYLLAQYLRGKEGKQEDLELVGLTKIYKNLHTVNINIAARLQSVLRGDSSVNAIILLDMLANSLPFVIKDKLQEVRYLFTPYLSEKFDENL